jgi:hypothetical protein
MSILESQLDLAELGLNCHVLNKTKILSRCNDFVDVSYIVNNIPWEQMEELINHDEQPKMAWCPAEPQFLKASEIWQKVHPEFVVNQGWNQTRNIYTVRTNYIKPLTPLQTRKRHNKYIGIERWVADVKIYLNLIDVMGFEEAKNDMSEWNIHRGFNKDNELVSFTIDWDAIIQLDSEESAYRYYKEEMCRWHHLRAYFTADKLNINMLEEEFDRLWRAKVG